MSWTGRIATGQRLKKQRPCVQGSGALILLEQAWPRCWVRRNTAWPGSLASQAPTGSVDWVDSVGAGLPAMQRSDGSGSHTAASVSLASQAPTESVDWVDSVGAGLPAMQASAGSGSHTAASVSLASQAPTGSVDWVGSVGAGLPAMQGSDGSGSHTAASVSLTSQAPTGHCANAPPILHSQPKPLIQ